MFPLRYRDHDTSVSSIVLSITAGAVAGFAAGVLLGHRVGGLEGLGERLRRGGDDIASSVRRRFEEAEEQYDDFDEDDDEAEEAAHELEDRVLEAFRNDPVLGERAVDIGAMGPATIELSGWVHTESESEHAVTIARGTPGVETVVNRLTVGEQEDLYDDNARRVAEGDPALTEARWEGQQIGTGRRRQGTSDEPDRHSDPRPNLEDRWLSEREALKHAAEDVEGIAERRRSAKKQSSGGTPTDGSPTSRGVPKGDHVENPSESKAD